MDPNVNNIPEGIVVFKNEPVVVPSPSQQKTKKPKHLKRKLAAATATGDAEKLATLEKEKAELAKIKVDAAASFKKKVRKLVIKMHGEETWNPDKYDQYIAGGVVGNRLLQKFKISLEQQQAFDAQIEVEKKKILKKRRRDESSDSDSSDSES